jgi:hypothetical protein
MTSARNMILLDNFVNTNQLISLGEHAMGALLEHDQSLVDAKVKYLQENKNLISGFAYQYDIDDSNLDTNYLDMLNKYDPTGKDANKYVSKVFVGGECDQIATSYKISDKYSLGDSGQYVIPKRITVKYDNLSLGDSTSIEHTARNLVALDFYKHVSVTPLVKITDAELDKARVEYQRQRGRLIENSGYISDLTGLNKDYIKATTNTIETDKYIFNQLNNLYGFNFDINLNPLNAIIKDYKNEETNTVISDCLYYEFSCESSKDDVTSAKNMLIADKLNKLGVICYNYVGHGGLPTPDIKGDINNDFTFNIVDIYQIVRYLCRASTLDQLAKPNKADINGDGKINICDIVAGNKILHQKKTVQ